MGKAKVIIMPKRPEGYVHERTHSDDPRYVEGQRLLVDAIRYLLQTDRASNRRAAELLMEHVRTQFRMSDSPLGSASPQA